MTNTMVASNSPMPQTTESIEAFLTVEIARCLNIEANQVDTQVSFNEYDLESTEALILLDKLETRLGRTLSPTMLWNYPTIESLAQYLAQDEDSTP